MTRSGCHCPTRRVIGILLAAAVLMAAAGDPVKAQSPTVRLVVDYGDGVTKTIAQLPWAKGSTVLDVMNAAKNRPHGISFEYTGSGAASFLTRIDDLANQGGGKKNWQLWVLVVQKRAAAGLAWRDSSREAAVGAAEQNQ